MNRLLSFSTGPEVIMGLATLAVFAFSARYNSYSDADVRVLTRLLLVLPVLLVLLAFFGFYLPTITRGWGGLVRINIAVQLALIVSSWRIVSGFAAPGSGPAGQDAGFILALALGLGASAIANAIYISALLRAQRPALASWYQEHGVSGVLLTAFTTIPVFIAELVITGGLAVIAGIAAPLFKR